MPNTKSAEKRTRSTAKKTERNRYVKSRLKTLEKSFLKDAEANNAEAAATSLKQVNSALDKAAKVHVIHKEKANRKKSRLAHRLNKIQAA